MAVIHGDELHELTKAGAGVDAVHKGVAGVGILLHIVLDPERLQRVLQTLRAPAQLAVTRPIARDDRTCADQALHRVSGYLAVVDRRRREREARRRQQCEASPLAEPEEPGLAGAVLARAKPATGRLDVLIRLAAPRA